MFRAICWCLSACVVMTLLSPGIRLLPGDRGRSDGGEAKPAWEETIRRGLDKPVTLEVIETPLGDVMEVLAAQAGIPNVQIDNRALEVVGIGSDTPITWNLQRISLRNVLRLVLKELDLTFVIRDEVLLITTPEEAETRLVTQIFNVLDLVRLHDDALPDEYDYDTLIVTITSIVAPTTWVDAGGSGSIGGFRGTLVVSQTQVVLDQIPPLLDTVRKARQIVRERGTQTPPVTSMLAGPPRVEAIDRALSRQASYDFQETPLVDVVRFLERLFEIPIVIDNRAIEDIGLGSDVPVTFSATDLTLGSALRRILEPEDLTYMQTCSILLITTPEEEELTLETRIYPVGDLLGGVFPRRADGSVNFDRANYDTLIELTTSAVAPVTWYDTGGPGTVEAMPFGLCVVSQTAEVHTEIERLFAKLRNTIPREDMTAQAEDEDGLRLVVYIVGSPTPPAAVPRVTPTVGQTSEGTHATPGRLGGTRVLAQLGAGGLGGVPTKAFAEGELLEIVQELVAPESWKAEGVYARAAAGRLIIRQTDDVHRKIRRVLNRLGVNFCETPEATRVMQGVYSGNMGGMGAGMGGGGMF